MKTIDSWNDLREYGIDLLTGEACRYGMRYLCDVSETGAATVREFLGLPANAPLSESWNSGRGNVTGPSVGSVMIPYTLFGQLATFCLFRAGASVVVVRTNGVVEGWWPDDEYADGYEAHMEFLRAANQIDRTYSPIGGPGVGSRMTHAMSERTV